MRRIPSVVPVLLLALGSSGPGAQRQEAPDAKAAPAAQAPYRVTRVVGDHPFLFEFRSSATAVFPPPADEALSSWQPLPFAWKYFGQPVDGYFVSDNGYVTFDRSAKASDPVPRALPDPVAPRAAILAFWTDMRLEAGHGPWVGHVYSATLGAAPDRIHAIYWMGPIARGEAFARSSYNFLIALSESGEFEVIFASGRRGAPVKALVGATGPDGLAVTAEPFGFDYPTVGFGGADDVTYRFTPAAGR
jgi:hypothetical protein